MKWYGRILAFGFVMGWTAFAGAFQEIDKGPKPGTWVIDDAVGSNARKWTGTIVLEKKGDLTYAGHTDWASADGADTGRELFEAIYDPRAKTITFVGKSVEVKSGTIVATTYVATAAADGKKMTDGRWAAVGGFVSGKWGASWKKD